MKTNQNRIENLTAYVEGLLNKKDGKELYLKYKQDIEGVTPAEVFEILYRQLHKGVTTGEILIFLDKIINVFYKSLTEYNWEKPRENTFLWFLMEENRALTAKLDGMKDVIKLEDFETRKQLLIPKVHELVEFKQHYLKKENLLFPYLERKMEKFNGLSIMWALHDETRKLLKDVGECLKSRSCDEKKLNIELGKLFFAMLGLVKKEELILFPAASEVICEGEWEDMLRQSYEYGFSFIEKPQAVPHELDSREAKRFSEEIGAGYEIKTETGTLSLEQIWMVFNSLPVDLTFVDEDNKVRFFSRPKDRLFPRSPAIIGRDVAKCHPPESVHMVHEIIEAFRGGMQDHATFWINLNGKMILIQYFALRDGKGKYRGVLEVSQDITEIKGLQGERRLLHWEKE